MCLLAAAGLQLYQNVWPWHVCLQPKKANACLASVTMASSTALALVEPDDEDDAKLPSYASHYP
jgi:hypothetical protein